MIAPPPPSLLSVMTAVVVLGAIVASARSTRRSTAYPSRLADFLIGPWAPLVAGLVTCVFVRIVWGSFHEPGVVHDERAYLLQAEIFARGHWTAPSPPLAAFFEQMHVFIEPAVFAKYPPAHALTLAPGVWLGLPGLMPVVMSGVAGALVFWIARRLANEWIALTTWWLWATAWPTLHWSASYLSETTSGLMWLIAVWATLAWLDTRRPALLLAAAGAIVWGLEARPLTMAVLALPLTAAIVRQVVAERAWKTLVAPVALAASMLAISPVWNQHTLGSWRLDPYPYYSRVYFPFDKPGFGADPTPPLRPPVPALAELSEWSRDLHARYTVASVPLAFAQRLVTVVAWCADGWRLALAALVLMAIRHATKLEQAAIATVALLMLAYLSFAHPPVWMVYYVEVLPIFCFLAAREIGRLLHKAAGLGDGTEVRWPASAVNASLAVLLILLPLGVNDVRRVRDAIDLRNAFHRSAEMALAALPPGKAIVFVSYGPSHSQHYGLTRNEADLSSAPHWIVYDRGPDNRALRALAPDRIAYRLDADTMRLERLP
ncbi:MAG TPA: hypothetical protein VKD69_07715 [Vicinamibacterales bacterium]|nr:hypothetical protein [Vicinamibacterales bacterium]